MQFACFPHECEGFFGRHIGFLLQSKNMLHRVMGVSELPQGVHACVAIDRRPVQDMPHNCPTIAGLSIPVTSKGRNFEVFVEVYCCRLTYLFAKCLDLDFCEMRLLSPL